MPPRRNIRDEDWERLRPTIRKFYLEEDRSLKDVLLILGTFHSFYPSKAQLEWKLKQWHFTKNMGVMDWKYVGNEIHRRKCRGKESKVYLSGIPLRTKAIEKGVSRYCYETAIEKAMRHVPEPPMPEEQPLLVCTPSPQDMNQSCRLDNLPWFGSKRLIEDLALKIPHNMSISPYSHMQDSCSEDLLFSIVFPRFAQYSYTTLLQRTFKRLRIIMPEECEDHRAVRSHGLLQKGRSNVVNAESLVCITFLLSNNIFHYTGNSQDEDKFAAITITQLLLHLFRESGSNLLAQGQYSVLPLSLQSSLDGLFREAVNASDVRTVRLLLHAGVDVNSSFSASRYVPDMPRTALQHAAAANQPELLEMLIEFGADTRKIDIHTIHEAWEWHKMARGSLEETMKILLSFYRFCPEDEVFAVRLLFLMSYTASTPTSEALIRFFWSSFRETICSPAAKAQLLITAVRTNSDSLDGLITDFGDNVNSCGYYPETPMTAAAYKSKIQLCKKLLRLGATFEPDHEAPTPLQWAAWLSDVSVVKQLLNEGADANFCHPYPTLLRFSLEDLDWGRFSFAVLNDLHSGETHLDGLIGSLGRTALQAALLGGNTDTASYLLTQGSKLVGGELVMAVWTGQLKLIGSLLERGASFQDECTVFSANTVLEATILSTSTDLVYQVIAADTQSVTGQALCASICLAKATNDLTIFKHLLTYKSQLLASQDIWIGTAICLAVHLECMEIPEMIMSSGLHPERSWPFGHRNFRIYDDPGRSTSMSLTGIICSYMNWRRELRTRSRDHQSASGRPMVEVAVSLGHISFLKLLLSYGYHPEPTSPLGITRRLYVKSDIDILRLLHSLGIKMTERVLTHVIESNGQNREPIQWLLSVGVDISERPEGLKPRLHASVGMWWPRTPLQAAVLKGDVDLIQELIEYGADVDEPAYTYDGSTSLQIAAKSGYFGIVQRLLELGANPNAPGAESPWGRTAIETAAECGRLDIVQLLLNSGVEISQSGRRQYVRSIALAEKEGHHAVTKLLKSHAGWTESDQKLLSETDLFHSPPTKSAFRYVRRYYSNESDSDDSAEDESTVGYQLPEGDGSCPGDFVMDIDVAHEWDDKFRDKTLFHEAGASEAPLAWDDTCCRIQELTEEVDEPSEVLRSTLNSSSNLPDAYGALLEEIGLEFLPSSMSHQIREELEGDGRHEESGSDLWAEEYSRFITELI